MSMDLTGIRNINEYYTNHYLASIFAENVKETLSGWREKSQETGESTPWARLREVGRRYYVLKDRYARERSPIGRGQIMMEMAVLLLEGLSYQLADSTLKIHVRESVTIPILMEVKKANGAPLLWAMLSSELNEEQNLLQGGLLNTSWRKETDEWLGEPIEDLGKAEENIADMDCETMLTKILFAQDEPPRWVILIGMDQVALIDRTKWNEKRLLEFDLDEIFGRHEETTLQAMAVLLHKDTVCPSDGVSLLDTLSDNSHKHASGVSEDLKYALRECIELLGNEAVFDMKERQHVGVYDKDLADQLTRECLRFMYRILFLLFIEARPELDYAPMNSAEYLKGYSLESLRDISDGMREDSDEVNNGTYLYQTLNKLFDLIHNGYPNIDVEQTPGQFRLEDGPQQGTFTIQPLKAHIFDLERTPLLNKVRLRNITLLKIIDLMSISRPRGGRQRRGRISYSALGINQLGAVYEALLSYRGFFAEDKLYEVKRAGTDPSELEVGYFVNEAQLSEYDEDERVRESEGSLKTYEKGTFIYRLAGRERQKSASYYTPEPLTNCLVKYALKELLNDKTADEILDLTICEPAMGSAAFLNEAVSQLAEAYLQLKQKETGESIAHDRYAEERQKVKMYIADHNVYGIDLNPVAVELAEVSLWLNTIYAGSYVPWFGTQLKCGNSLIGARRQVYSLDQITAAKAPKIWYANAPERLMPGKMRNENNQVYHFLLGDPGMADYTDKVIKELAGEQLKQIKDWRKDFVSSLNSDETKTLLRLSQVIDDLWIRHTDMRRQINEMTTDDLPVFGRVDNSKHTPSTTREKDDIYQRLYLTEGMQNAGPYARLKFAMDYWCTLWFWPIEKAELLPTRQEYLLDMSLILEGGIMSVHASPKSDLFEDDAVQLALNMFKNIPEVNLNMLCDNFPRLQMVRGIAKRYKFLHWELEFSDIFVDRGGFDLVVGNPPWVKVTWHEYGVLSDFEPKVEIKKLTAPEALKLRGTLFQKPEVKSLYVNQYEEVAASQRYYCAIQNYPDLVGVQTDLYKCFLPQAWMIANCEAVSAFIHPEGVYDEASCGILRAAIYPRLKYHFQFQNETLLFPIAHSKVYSLNVYSNKISNSFYTMSNLFYVSTIDESFGEGDFGELPGFKDENGKWNAKGHSDRKVHIRLPELELFSTIFEDGEVAGLNSRMPIIHGNQFLNVYKSFASHKRKIGTLEDIYPTEMWHESNAQNDGTIIRETRFPQENFEAILSGPNIGIANPFFQSPRNNCQSKGDNDVIDLVSISQVKNYLPRTNYVPNVNKEEYLKRAPKTDWGIKYIDNYRLVVRKMLSKSSELKLKSAIIPPGVGHINGLLGFAFRDTRMMVYSAGLFASLPYVFLINATGKTNIYRNLANILPLPVAKQENAITLRALLLNCLSEDYDELWRKMWVDTFVADEWTKKDCRLSSSKFTKASPIFSIHTPLRTDYERRQALVEIDVLTAMALGMKFNDLITIYRIQYPYFQETEKNTWYDQNGRVVFTVNKSLSGVGLTRPDWEQIKDLKSGIVMRIIMNDTMPGGPVERTIEYMAPFDRCNREKDYETAWRHFEQRFGKRGEGEEV
ncbi:MAG TPA: N-6 DNA methylase [Desulfosporosinus sp.]|nr:N-6 DNA methylase [Desulfosporosinus sp.]